METFSGHDDDPAPSSVAYFTVEHLGEHIPHTYLGVLLATGSNAYEAVTALEERALSTARREHAQITNMDYQGSRRHTYVVIGLRITAGMSSSGQPDWVAYGTLLQMRHEEHTPSSDLDVGTKFASQQ